MTKDSIMEISGYLYKNLKPKIPTTASVILIPRRDSKFIILNLKGDAPLTI